MTRDEAIELFTNFIRTQPVRCDSCINKESEHICAFCIVNKLLEELPFLAIVDREANQAQEDMIAEGWVKELKQ